MATSIGPNNASTADANGKPFVFAELVARVRALSRRAPSAPPVLRRGDLTVDRARHRAGRGSRPLSLTRKEFGILEMLLAADGALVSADELLEHGCRKPRLASRDGR
jgi:DNA-binding response OmpR family regulator